ncbi:MAG: metallophosphatase family protein [Spirochaetota bacterium]|jgi:putative phosphoesterase|nr:metallophosphatase family protein [Spirochaetota bacterium]
MKMAVFSDSHKNIRLLGQALETAFAQGASMLVHLGDHYSDLDALDCRDAIVYRVPGLPNVDSVPPGVEAFARFAFLGQNIFALHDREKLPAEGRSPEITLVLYGHTHMADCSRCENGVWYLNPGHLKAPMDRDMPASFALLRAEEGGLIGDFLSPEGKLLFSRALSA